MIADDKIIERQIKFPTNARFLSLEIREERERRIASNYSRYHKIDCFSSVRQMKTEKMTLRTENQHGKWKKEREKEKKVAQNLPASLTQWDIDSVDL